MKTREEYYEMIKNVADEGYERNDAAMAVRFPISTENADVPEEMEVWCTVRAADGYIEIRATGVNYKPEKCKEILEFFNFLNGMINITHYLSYPGTEIEAKTILYFDKSEITYENIDNRIGDVLQAFSHAQYVAVKINEDEMSVEEACDYLFGDTWRKL